MKLRKIQEKIESLYSDKKMAIRSLEGQGRGIPLGLIQGQQKKVADEYDAKIAPLELQKKHMIERRTLMIAVAGILVTAVIAMVSSNLLGSTAKDEDFPVVNEPSKAFETSYWVCADPTTGDRIYKSHFNGDDSGWESFFDKNGNLIEATPEMGSGAMNNLQPTTGVENCIRTTEDYFKSQMKTQ